MTSDGTRTFEWDARNQLVAVNTGTQRSEFAYDGLRRRVRMPAFVGVVLLKRFEIVAMALLLIGYTLLCFSIVKLTDRLRGAKRHSQGLVSPGG
jgi:YD repeat-containing protein